MTSSGAAHTAYFWSGDALRSRSVGRIVRSSVVHIPAPPARLEADWHRETTLRLGLEPGDVEAMPLARARTRWPDYKQCVQAMADWLATQGLPGVLATADVALMACRGAHHHHDGEQYGGMAFCNLFLSEDRGLDVHFPATGHRIPLVRGTVVLFDTCQPHAVIDRNGSGFHAADFPADLDRTQLFLTWELPIENPAVSGALQVTFDTDPSTALQLRQEQVWVNSARAIVCPASGRWLSVD